MKAPTSTPNRAQAPTSQPGFSAGASRPGAPANADTLLRCNSCGRKSNTSFVRSLSKGWERCCEGTMRLVRTEADVKDAVAQLPTLEEIVQAGHEGEGER